VDDGSMSAAATIQTAFAMPSLMSTHCHSPGDATLIGSGSIDVLRQTAALQYVASLGYLQH